MNAKSDKIAQIKLKDNKILEITDEEIRIYKKNKLVFTVHIENVFSIRSKSDTEIGICYIKDDLGSNLIKCRTEVCELGSKLSTLDACKEIYDKFVELDIISNHKKEMLYLKLDEEIVSTFPVSIDKRDGVLYVTNERIIYEANNTVHINLFFEQIISIRAYKSNDIIIRWECSLPALNDPTFSLELSVLKFNRDTAYTTIKEQFASNDPFFIKSDLDLLSELCNFVQIRDNNFSEYHKYHSKLTRKEFYKLSSMEDPILENYIKMYAKFTFGHFTPEFSDIEEDLILACKLGGWNISLISHMTTTEERQRLFAKRRLQLSKFIQDELGIYKEDITNLNKSGSISDETRTKLENDPEFMKLYDKAMDIYDKSPEMAHPEYCINKMRAESARYYDRRVAILYKEWCENEPLQEFTDVYEDRWIRYLLKRLNNPQGRKPFDNRCATYSELRDALSERDRRRKLLENFLKPDNTDQRDIYNNCWYDKQHKMWYVQDDDLPIDIEDLADSDPDESERAIGRRVWGFKEIKMFCGFPAIVIESEDSKSSTSILCSRKTGQMIRMWSDDEIHFLLPTLRDDDINEEMKLNHNHISFVTNEIEYMISPSGAMTSFSPKIQKIVNQQYGCAVIPLNELVRRAIFSVETGLFFDPQAELGSDIIKDPKTYPEILYDERY